jgi:hypothetical protein
LTPRHFLWSQQNNSKDSKLFLIDFGFSVLWNSSSPVETVFSGSSHYAPTSLLSALSDYVGKPEPYVYQPCLQHDLESVSKVCFIRVMPSLQKELSSIGMKDYRELHNFWHGVEHKAASTFWRQAFEYARQDKLDETLSIVISEGVFI